MHTNIGGELASDIDTIAVSARAKGQIGSQAAEAKVRSADPKLRGPNFLDSFSDFNEIP